MASIQKGRAVVKDLARTGSRQQQSLCKSEYLCLCAVLLRKMIYRDGLVEYIFVSFDVFLRGSFCR